MNRIDQDGINLIKKWEGLYLKAYQDSVGVWTIGWGSIKNTNLGIDVYPGLVITREKAEEWLHVELDEKAVALNRLLNVPVSQGEFNVLMSFEYNLGIGALQHSTLLKLLNQRNYDAVPAQILRYDHGDGRVIRGLTERRRDEARIWTAAAHGVQGPHTETPTSPHPELDSPPTTYRKITARVAPLGEAIHNTLSSKTAKAAAGQVVVTATAVTKHLHDAAVSPLAYAVICASLGVGAFILFRKFHDLREGR